MTGCASNPNGESAGSAPVAGKHILREGEYRQVNVTGSLIPVRVPTSPSARPLPQSSSVSTVSGEDFDRVVRRGQTGR
jgi:hypothetical protein